MLQFLDTSGNPLPPRYEMTQQPAVAGEIFQLQFERREGVSFFAEVSDAAVVVEARQAGDSNWTNIVTDPILLSPLTIDDEDLGTVLFELRITSPDDEGDYQIELKLEVV